MELQRTPQAPYRLCTSSLDSSSPASRGLLPTPCALAPRRSPTLQEAEVTRLAGIEAAADRLRGQLAGADASLAERDSTIQLLNADKAYLSKEVQVGGLVQHSEQQRLCSCCWWVCCSVRPPPHSCSAL